MKALDFAEWFQKSAIGNKIDLTFPTLFLHCPTY